MGWKLSPYFSQFFSSKWVWFFLGLLFLIIIFLIILYWFYVTFKQNEEKDYQIYLPATKEYKKYPPGSEMVLKPYNAQGLSKIFQRIQKYGKSYAILAPGYSPVSTKGFLIDLSLLSGTEIIHEDFRLVRGSDGGDSRLALRSDGGDSRLALRSDGGDSRLALRSDGGDSRLVRGSDGIVRIGATTSIQNVHMVLLPLKKYLPFDIPNLSIEEAVSRGIYGSVRKYGFFSESVIKMEIVLADGSIETITQSDELFGAVLNSPPGSFGIVTSYYFRTYQMPSVIVTFKNTYSLDHLAKVVSWVTCSRRRKRTRDLNFKIIITKDNVVLDGIFFGFVRLLARRLRDLPEAIETDIEEVNMVTFLSKIKPIPHPMFQKVKSHFGKEELTEKVVENIKKTLQDIEIDFSITIYHLPGPYLIVYEAIWDEIDEEESNVPWQLDQIEALYQKNEPFVLQLSHFGFFDVTLKDPRKAYYGKYLRKILKIKKRFDSYNFFHQNFLI